MNKEEEAIRIIDEIMVKLPEDSKEAEALFMAKAELSQKTKYPFIKCKNCGYGFQRIPMSEYYDKEFGIHEYYTYCPNCNQEYEWNNCYWR